MDRLTPLSTTITKGYRDMLIDIMKQIVITLLDKLEEYTSFKDFSLKSPNAPGRVAKYNTFFKMSVYYTFTVPLYLAMWVIAWGCFLLILWFAGKIAGAILTIIGDWIVYIYKLF